MRPGERCRAVLEMPLSLAPGTYFFTISAVGTDETKYDLWFDALSFTVAPTPLQLYTPSLLGVPVSSSADTRFARLNRSAVTFTSGPGMPQCSFGNAMIPHTWAANGYPKLGTYDADA
jgi:hypothetical protein